MVKRVKTVFATLLFIIISQNFLIKFIISQLKKFTIPQIETSKLPQHYVIKKSKSKDLDFLRAGVHNQPVTRGKNYKKEKPQLREMRVEALDWEF